MLHLEYVSDSKGNPKGVIIPIDIWKSIFESEGNEIDENIFIEKIENYCLNSAMDEAKETELLNKEEALKFLED